MTTGSAVWPRIRPQWSGHIPKISVGDSTEEIFRLAWKQDGATIVEMLNCRKDSGKSIDVKKKALLKLLKAIEKAYLVKLVVDGDNYRFIPENSGGSVTINTAHKALARSYLPTKEDFEIAYKMVSRLGETISLDSVLDQLEISANEKGHLLKSDWRIDTEKNIETWVKK